MCPSGVTSASTRTQSGSGRSLVAVQAQSGGHRSRVPQRSAAHAYAVIRGTRRGSTTTSGTTPLQLVSDISEVGGTGDLGGLRLTVVRSSLHPSSITVPPPAPGRPIGRAHPIATTSTSIDLIVKVASTATIRLGRRDRLRRSTLPPDKRRHHASARSGHREHEARFDRAHRPAGLPAQRHAAGDRREVIAHGAMHDPSRTRSRPPTWGCASPSGIGGSIIGWRGGGARWRTCARVAALQ